MNLFLKICLLLFSFYALASAQEENNINVEITEISPHKINSEEEWFEFTIESKNEVDITNWKISNGTSTKTFLEKKEFLVIGENSSFSSINETEIKIIPIGTTILYWSKSPVSLPNSGSIIQILDSNDNVLDEITYPNTKSGTLDGNNYVEIWNRHKTKENVLFPLIFRTEDPTQEHSKGKSNLNPPSFPDDIELLISEISTKRNSDDGFDFIELFIKSSTEDSINLKYLEIKHNGTPLIMVTKDFLVKNNDYILIILDGNTPFITKNTNPHQISTDKKDGLSSGSGTIEVILYSGTSWEQTEDFICWKDVNLSQTESQRVQKNIESNNWDGECINISELITNESIARTSPNDSNTLNDFFRHFNGSIGTENINQNSAPKSEIIVQGSQKIYKSYLNFTGDYSTDPDGKWDMKSFLWTINDKQCHKEESGWNWIKDCEEQSTKINPDRIYFSKVGTYAITLTIEDYSGTKNSATVNIEVTDEGIGPSPTGGGSGTGAFTSSIKKWIKKEMEKKTKKNNSNSQRKRGKKVNGIYIAPDDFFDDFLKNVDLELFEKRKYEIKRQKEIFIKKHQKPRKKYLFQRDKFSPEQKKRIAKNIGLIFSKKFSPAEIAIRLE